MWGYLTDGSEMESNQAGERSLVVLGKGKKWLIRSV